MEKEIQQLQYMITQNDDDAFFRELKSRASSNGRLHLASAFQYSKNPSYDARLAQCGLYFRAELRTEPVKQSKPEESFLND